MRVDIHSTHHHNDMGMRIGKYICHDNREALPVTALQHKTSAVEIYVAYKGLRTRSQAPFAWPSH